MLLTRHFRDTEFYLRGAASCRNDEEEPLWAVQAETGPMAWGLQDSGGSALRPVSYLAPVFSAPVDEAAVSTGGRGHAEGADLSGQDRPPASGSSGHAPHASRPRTRVCSRFHCPLSPTCVQSVLEAGRPLPRAHHILCL